MEIQFHLLTNVDIPRELARRVWLLQGKLNALLAKLDFDSPKQLFGLWVEAHPPRPDWAKSLESKPEVKLDRRDGGVRTVVIGDFERYRTASLADGVDLFVADAQRAIRQVPAKFLIPEEAEQLIIELENARKEYHIEHTGHIPARSDVKVRSLNRPMPGGEQHDEAEADELDQQIVLQWPDNRQLSPDAKQFYASGGADDISSLEDMIELEAEGLYYVDGHDIGAGTLNIFLYAKDREVAIKKLIALAKAKSLPEGVRIGVPMENSVSFRAHYPPGLKTFGLMGAVEPGEAN